MLIVETIGRIRREHLAKGKSIKEIARDLRISRNTVRRILRSGETSFSYERAVQPRPRLGRWKADLDGLLTANAGKPARERLTLIRLFEELRALGMRAATTQFAATPEPGAANTRARQRRLLCLCRSLQAKPTSLIGATKSSCWMA